MFPPTPWVVSILSTHLPLVIPLLNGQAGRLSIYTFKRT